MIKIIKVLINKPILDSLNLKVNKKQSKNNQKRDISFHLNKKIIQIDLLMKNYL